MTTVPTPALARPALASALRGAMSSALDPTRRARLVTEAESIVIRVGGNTTDLSITATTFTTATSIGAITIADGGHVQVLDGKTWRIT